MNEITVTVIGNVASDVRHVTSKRGTSISSFRLANTPRRLAGGQWSDGPTSFMTVTCWRTLADHAASSLHKGEPVIVVGRLRVNDWESNGRSGRDVEIDAISLGHDLNRGTSAFRRVKQDTPVDNEDYAAAEALRGDVRETPVDLLVDSAPAPAAAPDSDDESRPQSSSVAA